MSKPLVAFVGLDAMGQGEACSLLRAGYTVRGFDVNPRALSAFAQAGSIAASSPALAAQGALLFVLVFNAEQVEAVLYRSDGAAAGLPKGATSSLGRI